MTPIDRRVLNAGIDRALRAVKKFWLGRSGRGPARLGLARQDQARQGKET